MITCSTVTDAFVHPQPSPLPHACHVTPPHLRSAPFLRSHCCSDSAASRKADSPSHVYTRV